MVIFIAVLEQGWQVQEIWCAIDREIKYLDFVSGHSASTETEWPRHIQVTNKIQVASISMIELVNATIKYALAPLEVGPELEGWINEWLVVTLLR